MGFFVSSTVTDRGGADELDWNRAARLGDLKIPRRGSEDLCSHSLGFIFFFFAAKHARYQIRACPDRTSLRARGPGPSVSHEVASNGAALAAEA